jgi:hypothetical protein
MSEEALAATSSPISVSRSDILGLSDRTLPHDADMSVLTPVDMSELAEGLPVEFLAESLSRRTGLPVPSGEIMWASSVDGFMGAGNPLSTNALSAGSHMVTVAASGYMPSAHVSIIVLSFSDPSRPEEGEVV